MKTLVVFALTLSTAFSSFAQTTAPAIQNLRVDTLCENAEWRVSAKFSQDIVIDNVKKQIQPRAFNVVLSIPKYDAEEQNDELEAKGHRIPEAVFVDERPTLYTTSCRAYTETLIGCNVMEKNSTVSGYKIRLTSTGEKNADGSPEVPKGEIIAWHSNGEAAPLPLTCQPSEMIEIPTEQP